MMVSPIHAWWSSYGDIDLGQHCFSWWLVAWRHQAITWTNVDFDFSSLRNSDIHLMAVSQEMPQPSTTEIILKITCIKFYSNLPGVNELNWELCCLPGLGSSSLSLQMMPKQHSMPCRARRSMAVRWSWTLPPRAVVVPPADVVDEEDLVDEVSHLVICFECFCELMLFSTNLV